MIRVALGQGKMGRKPVAGFLHMIVYIGFVIINIELLEIILDGLLGTHRIFSPMGVFYGFLIGSFEILALLVLLAVVIFWARRNIFAVKRLQHKELKGWAKKDGNYIIYFEMVLMGLFLLMNASDVVFQQEANGNIISKYLYAFFQGYPTATLHFVERFSWWLHIVGILVFLNYLYYSKHLHIILAFPNTYYANLNPYGQFKNDAKVTEEVKLMLDPNADPFAVTVADESTSEEGTFGAEDVRDLSWVQLMNAYACTECGRCTDVCPANITGKKLSPRAIMMKTRDRIETVGREINTAEKSDKKLLGGYITPEEIWACTTCNACVDACPINIDPLSIIMDLRKFLVMEKSQAPTELNNMMTNIENNGAPWQYSQQDRLNWI